MRTTFRVRVVAGPVEWAALVLLCTLLLGSLSIAWRARGILADVQIQIAVKIAELEKDVRHSKNNILQHAVIGSELMRDVAVLKNQVERHARVLNGAVSNRS